MKSEIMGFEAPKKKCLDQKCPFHGQLNVKRELFKGIVIKKDSHHSATLEWNRSYYLPKYERYETRRSRLRVHNPPCLNAQVGQQVLAARTHPLSKTKNHVIIQIIKKEIKAEKTAPPEIKEKDTKKETKKTTNKKDEKPPQRSKDL